MKKLLGLLLVLSIIFVSLTACSSKSNSEGDKNQPAGSKEDAKNESQQQETKDELIELNMYHSWSTDTDRGKALENLINKFNSEHEGKIKINATINPDFPAYQEKVKTMIATDTTPDIFNYNFNPNDLSRQNSGKLLDFSPYMDDEWASRFGDGDLETLTINGELTSIPFEKAGALFYYNKDLFTKAGISEFPKTWDEFFDVCEKLKSNGITPISLYTADDAWYTTNLMSYLAASCWGTEALNAGGSINSPEMVRAAELLYEFLKNYTTGDAIGANYSVAMNNFASEKTAIIIDGPWLIGSIGEIADKVGIAPAPTFGDGVVKPGFTVTDAQTPWSAAKQKDKKKEEAIVEFMKFMTSEESTKQLTLEGSVFLSAKLNLTEDELANAGKLLGEYITVNSASPESIVNMQRNLTTTATSKLPSLLESLALDLLTPSEFIEQLSAENQ